MSGVILLALSLVSLSVARFGVFVEIVLLWLSGFKRWCSVVPVYQCSVEHTASFFSIKQN